MEGAWKDVTEDSMNGPGAIREGFLEEAMNTIESDAENDNNQHVSNTYICQALLPKHIKYINAFTFHKSLT